MGTLFYASFFISFSVLFIIYGFMLNVKRKVFLRLNALYVLFWILFAFLNEWQFNFSDYVFMGICFALIIPITAFYQYAAKSKTT